MRNKGWLVSDWDNRDPDCDLDNIDDGKYLEAITNLPNSLKMLLEDTDIRVNIQEVDGRYQITKIVKKRDAEYLQGKEQRFLLSDDGTRIPITEDELDEVLGLKSNPDDVYNCSDVELSSVHSEYTAPMDAWDVVFDATTYIQEMQRTMRTLQYFPVCVKATVKTKIKGLTQTKQVRKEIYNWRDLIEFHQDEFLYSANWFPRRQDKKLRTKKAKLIEQGILTGRILTRRDLGTAMGPVEPEDGRKKRARELRAAAEKTAPSPRKAKMLQEASKLTRDYMQALKTKKNQQALFASERRYLWDLWRSETAKRQGSVQLTSWQFERAYRLKLQKEVKAGTLNKKQATANLRAKMSKLYKQGRVLPVEELKEPKMPQWLLDAPPPPKQEETQEDFVQEDWLCLTEPEEVDFCYEDFLQLQHEE